MHVRTAVRRGQRRAESLMTDLGYVRRQTGEATDPDTGKITPTYADVYGSADVPAKCRFKAATSGMVDRRVGEQYVQLSHPELQVPFSATGIRDGDEFVGVTMADPDLVGVPFKVASDYGATQSVMRRFMLERVT